MHDWYLSGKIMFRFIFLCSSPFKAQYKFIYAAIDERLALGGTEMQLSASENTLNNMIETDTGMTKLREQFQVYSTIYK